MKLPSRSLAVLITLPSLESSVFRGTLNLIMTEVRSKRPSLLPVFFILNLNAVTLSY